MNLIINAEKLFVVHLETSYAKSTEFLVFDSTQLNLSDVKPAINKTQEYNKSHKSTKIKLVRPFTMNAK